MSAPSYAAGPYQPHAPNAALLIDFDNVTMGIRSDLGNELRNLLSSDIIKGKVAVQRAYADWRRYPQYIVPLTEASIDLIFAPAYGSSKKNATDIRLAIDAMELVFTRPEIGTIILLSGDSDFSSLVIKLKEYGKYIIGVGIRESSSDLLVMNCDEYYSYNALAGLVKNSDEEPARKWDPWELVTEAVTRMKRNGDVMRSDRLKQVMQEIDSTFDEKDLGMAKFSRFVQDAVHRGLISATKLENGQLEIGLPAGAAAEPRAAEQKAAAAPAEEQPRAEQGDAKREGGRGRRGRRGRGGRDREERPRAGAPEAQAAAPAAAVTGAAPEGIPVSVEKSAGEQIGASGERLTRDEAYDLVRRSVAALTSGDESVSAGAVRAKARELLGRDSESLSDRNFPRILKDAHDGDVIDLRRRGDDFEVARAADAEPVSAQLAKTEAANTPAAPSAPPAPRGMGPRGVSGPRGRGGRPGAPPPELLSLGVVGPASAAAKSAAPSTVSAPSAPADLPASSAGAEQGSEGGSAATKGRGRRGAAKKAAKSAAPADQPAAKTAKKSAAKKAPAAKKTRARKNAARAEA
ncbi:MAG TPA: NYN domain-containing protein [Gemmatimonadaceae bacterium]|nr:NYN domain-containing protein [Gemmatimonadaceae bacterium]